MHEIVALQQLVAELGVADAFGALLGCGSGVGFGGANTALYRVLGHHVVYGEVLAYLAQKLQKAKVFEPVVVVHDQRPGGSGGEVQKLLQLCPNAVLVAAQGGFVEQVALGRFAAGVANHAGGAAYQGHRAVPGPLQVYE